MVDNRFTLRRSNPYHNLRNRVKPVRTPGNRLVAHYIEKRVNGPVCAETGKPLAGIPHVKTCQLRRMKKHQRTVSRPYGGVYCASVVKNRIIRAFMHEEAKAAQDRKKVVQQKAAPKNAQPKKINKNK
jgi:large subunit ribosomal protein L34e